jgi:hypothetical protein
LQTTSSLDELMQEWEKTLGAAGDPGTSLDAFLDLSAHDMRSAAGNIDCPFCRRHMLLEAGEISHVLHRLRADGNRPHSHGLGERLSTLAKSFEIIANVLLGGLRRAGII